MKENDNFENGYLPFILGIAGFIYVGLLPPQQKIKKNYIESDTKIESEIKLIIVDNKVDTLYVYKK